MIDHGKTTFNREPLYAWHSDLIYFSFMGERSGRRRQPEKRSALYYICTPLSFFLMGVYSVVSYGRRRGPITAPWTHGRCSAPPRGEVVSGFVHQRNPSPSSRFRKDGR